METPNEIELLAFENETLRVTSYRIIYAVNTFGRKFYHSIQLRNIDSIQVLELSKPLYILLGVASLAVSIAVSNELIDNNQCNICIGIGVTALISFVILYLRTKISSIKINSRNSSIIVPMRGGSIEDKIDVIDAIDSACQSYLNSKENAGLQIDEKSQLF